jgi:spore germination protein YaaH
MEQKKKLTIVGAILLTVIIAIAGIMVVKKLTPSKEVMKLSDYFQVAQDDVAIIMQDKIYEKNAKMIDHVVYIDYETVVNYFNKRFYWDSNENLLIYTTPTEIIKAEVGSKEYYVNKSKKSMDYEIVKTEGDTVYLALDYVKEFSNIEYTLYSEPNRVVINYIWDEDLLYAQIKEESQVRYKPSIKSPILEKMKKGDAVEIIVDEEEVSGKFTKVVTQDGVIGYIKNSSLKESYYEAKESTYEQPDYTSISKDYKINLVWHQVTNQDANNSLISLLENTKGVTTISPTWYQVDSVEGTVTSLASEQYVERAHNYGVEVWALVDDFTKGIDMNELLSYTSRREKLSNELIAEAIKYNLDGINIDFEKIPQAAATHYIQFLRELSVKCRNNGVILSVDNYVPSEYTSYYDREEQGKIVDYVITMAYDEHNGSSTESGSVASYDYVKDAIENVLKEVPHEKTIIALPFFTRLWGETEEGLSVQAYSMSQGETILEQNGVKPTWDTTTRQYYGEYTKDGVLYKMWLEEEKSIEEKMKLVYENEVAGVAGWKLGLEKSDIWNVLLKYIN